MARISKGPELYEILAARRNRQGGAFPWTTRTLQREREIIFSVNTAFVIFAAVVLLVASAYILGHRHGKEESRLYLSERTGNIESRGEVEVLPGIERGPTLRPEVAILDEKAYTLRLCISAKKDEAELERMKMHRAYILQHPIVREHALETYIFDNGAVYSLGVGLFSNRRDPLLLRLQTLFVGDGGPPNSKSPKPYQGCSPERIGDLGTPIPQG